MGLTRIPLATLEWRDNIAWFGGGLRPATPLWFWFP